MRQIFSLVPRIRARSRRHFTAYRDTVARQNLWSLRRRAICYEAVLLLYGLLFAPLFHSRMLLGFYCVFLALNTGFLPVAFPSKKKALPAFWSVQLRCMFLMVETLAFVICISTFPFPDRPAIFYPLTYMLILPLFQFPFWQMSLMLTAMTGIFCGLSVLFKTPMAWSYDLTGAVTAWPLGFIELVVVLDLHLRNGEARMELDRRSRTDPLTGLPNRREMDEFFDLTYRRCRELEIPLGVIMLDVDHFKRFNDRFGHPAGDDCLAAMGRELAEFTRELGLFAARYGGEEFLLLLPGCGEAEAAAHAGALRERLSYAGPDGQAVTVSLGVAVEHPGADGSLPALLRRADSALYRAKTAGRDRMVCDWK